MIKLTRESIKRLYQLDNIIRYNTFPKFKQESVATHSYYVALFTMMICDELDVDSEIHVKAIEMALVHDIPEVVINDVTYAAKKAIPGLREMLEKHELNILHDMYPRQYAYLNSPTTKEEIAEAIVRLADIISVLQFVDYEVSMGNQNVIDWVGDTIERIKVQKEKIERMGVKCQKIII
ncbi:MAG: HD domain-containing protein [Clostridia bacterium]|nr:HD domain-containing protein [Clostridia bacterium]